MDRTVGLDTVWVLLAAFLVFFMQAGFGMVEAGFIRAKNACNILMKNFLDFAVGCICFFLVGYAFMFGEGGEVDGFMGLSGFGLEGATNPSGVPLHAFWLFQACFCGAAATIVAGGMAGRMKFPAYLAYTAVVSAFVYPIIGHWVWGGGWLADWGFGDFAGSTVVHLTGGSIALVGTIILGPRIGKFGPDKKARAIPGHSIPLAALGVFLLWFGWFGFNPGSTLAVGDGKAISLVALNTNIAACAGAIAAMIAAWIMFGKPDPAHATSRETGPSPRGTPLRQACWNRRRRYDEWFKRSPSTCWCPPRDGLEPEARRLTVALVFRSWSVSRGDSSARGGAGPNGNAADGGPGKNTPMAYVQGRAMRCRAGPLSRILHAMSTKRPYALENLDGI